VFDVVIAAQSSANTSVNRLIAGDEPFERSLSEECAVLDLVLTCWRAVRGDFGWPSIEVSIEVDDCDGTVDAMEGTEDGEDDSVVSSERDYFGMGFEVGCIRCGGEC